MIFVAAGLLVLLQLAQSGVVPAPAVVSAPARFVAAPVSAPFIAPAPAPLIAAAPAPFTAFTRAVPQTVAPFAASVNYVARSPLLPYTVGSPVVSPLVETFSAPLVARKLAPVAAAAPLVAAPAPLVAAPAPFVGAVV